MVKNVFTHILSHRVSGASTQRSNGFWRFFCFVLLLLLFRLNRRSWKKKHVTIWNLSRWMFFLLRSKSPFFHIYGYILITQRYFGNQFNNRIVQSFILCHNLIKIRNSIQPNENGEKPKTQNILIESVRHIRTMCSLTPTACNTKYTIIDCSLHWSFTINQCVFFLFFAISMLCSRFNYFLCDHL